MAGQLEGRLALERAKSLLGEWLGVSPSAFRLNGRGVPPEVDLLVRTGWGRLVVEYKGSSSGGVIDAAIERLRRYSASADAVPIVAVPYMGEAGRRRCEAAGISWFDLSGNAHIVAKGLRILIEGRPSAFTGRGRPSTVFAPRSARVARRLLIDPDHAWRQRDLARETRLDEGFVSRIVRRLIDDGEVEREGGTLRLTDPGRLLDAWRAEYDFGKHTMIAGHVAGGAGDARAAQLGSVLSGRVQYAMTGLAGAWLLTQFAAFRTTTTFLAEPPTKALLADLGFREESRGANTWLVVPNDDGVFDGASEVGGVACAHSVQVFLDLTGHSERANEAADELRARALPWSSP